MGPLDMMLAVATNATNAASPDAAVGAASTAQNFDDAATNAQATMGYAQAASAAKNLAQQNGINQNQAWDQMSPTTQDQLKATGYVPPKEQGGLINDVEHGVSDVLHNRVFADITNALGSPLRAVQHGIRTGLAAAGGETANNPLNFLTADWARAWDETSNGVSYIDPTFQKTAVQRWGLQTYSLALKQATGASATQIIQAAPAAQQSQIAQALQSPDVQAATSYLNAGHLSVGRIIANHILGSQGRNGTLDVKPGGVYNWLSGSIDAAVDWFGDPTVVGGKFAGALKNARYLVSDGQDVLNLYAHSASVRQQMARLADGVREAQESGTGGYRMLEMSKSLANTGVIEHLISEGADTPEKVRNWFANTQNLMQFAKGSAIHADDPIYIPHLSYAGQLSMKAKGIMDRALNFGGDNAVSVPVGRAEIAPGPLVPQGTDRITVGAGRLVTRAFRLMPTSRIFNPAAPNAMANLRDIASMFLKPADVDRVVTEFASNPDIGARWQVYRSLMQSLGSAAGLQQGTDEWDNVMGRYASSYDRIYGPGGVDKMMLNGQEAHVGYLKAHINDGWLIPSFKELYTSTKKLGMTQRLTRGVNMNWMDKAMGVWRPLTLARLGFATRVGGEEAFGFLLREGPLDYLRAQGARLAERGMLRQQALTLPTEAEATGLEPIADRTMKDIVATDHGRTYNMLTSGLSTEEINSSRNIAQLFARRLARTVHGAMEKTGTALTNGTYLANIQHLIDHGELDEGNGLNEALTAAHYDTPVRATELDNIMKIKDKATGAFRPGEMQRTGAFRAYNPGDTENLYNMVYQRSLHQLATDDWGREALSINRPDADTVQAIANKLMEDPTWSMSHRMNFDRAENSVDAQDITRRQAAEDHANVILDGAHALLKKPNGDWITVEAGGDTAENLPEWRRAVTGTQTGAPLVVGAPQKEEPLAAYLQREGTAPPWFASQALREAGEPAQLSSIAPEDLPRDVAGPELVPSFGPGVNLRRMTNAMFQKVITPQINWLSRTPMRLHNYSAARQVFEGFADHLRAEGMDDEQVENLVHEHAVARAINTTIPYIHNPELRSQMSQVTRNLAPFWFAQEQFYKRWARTFFYSPWTFRQASLISNGLSHMGFIHTDPEDGQEYFVYPGSALTTDVITHVLGAFGVNDQVAVQADLVGQVSMLNPGLDRGFLPNYGPLAVVPMDGLKLLDPHMTQAINDIEGGNASSSDFLSSIMPTTITRLLDLFPQIDPSQYASAQMSAIQYLEATGHGLGFTATNQVGTLNAGQKPPKTAGPYKPGDYFTQGSDQYVLQPDGKWQDNSPQALTKYLDRVNNWSRIFMVTRAIYGFSGPASPENYFNPSGLSTQLQTLMNEMPYDQAVSTFMAMHPDATPMTVFQSANDVDGFLPATQTAMQFLNANPGLTSKYPLASTYFLPPADTTGKFDLAAYQEQMAQGLRSQKTPANYWTEIAYQEAANIYYGVESYKDQLVANNQVPYAQADQMWTTFSTKFMAANPLFAQMYSDQGEATRIRIMDQVGAAITEKAAPPGPQTTAIRKLYNAWVAWRGATTNYGQPNAPTSTSDVDVQNQLFAQAVAAFVAKNPGVQPLVQRVIAPELAETLTDMAAQGITVNL